VIGVEVTASKPPMRPAGGGMRLSVMSNIFHCRHHHPSRARLRAAPGPLPEEDAAKVRFAALL
jgi:hypothetical protein